MFSTRRSPVTTAALLCILAAILLAATGCAPHRRGPHGPVDDPLPEVQPQPQIVPPPQTAEDAAAEDVAAEPPAAWSEIDRDAPAADRVCAMADAFIGTPYRYGGTTPSGFDCSGLVQYVYREVGVTLPRTSREQARAGRRTDLRDLARGDLIFFRNDRDIISHVGIYVGEGAFIHAPGTGKHIRKDSLENDWWRRRVKAVRRVLAG